MWKGTGEGWNEGEMGLTGRIGQCIRCMGGERYGMRNWEFEEERERNNRERSRESEGVWAGSGKQWGGAGKA